MSFEPHHPSDARENAKVRREAALSSRRSTPPTPPPLPSTELSVRVRRPEAGGRRDGGMRPWMPAPTPSRRRGDVAGPRALQGESAGPPRAAKGAGHEAPKASQARPQGPDVRREEEAEEGLPASHAPKWHPLCEPKHPRGVLYNRIPKSGSASIMSWMSGQLNETARVEITSVRVHYARQM